MPDADALWNQARRRLRCEKIMTNSQISEMVGCSPRTTQRQTKQWGCHRSFNANGRYYALPEVVHFDSDGIWEWRTVCFSRFGNLTQTVVGVLDEAECGLSAGELAERLRLNVHSFLSQFAARSVVARESFAGVFRYFSADPSRACEQRHCYISSTGPVQPKALSDAAKIELLLAWIRAPESTPAQLCAQLTGHIPATADAVASFLAQHELGSEKRGS